MPGPSSPTGCGRTSAPRTAQLLDAETKARELGLNPQTLTRMAKDDRIPGARKVGRAWRFPAGELHIRPAGDRVLEPPAARVGGPGEVAASAIRGA